MHKLRTTLFGCLLLGVTSSSLYATDDFSLLTWKIPFYHATLSWESRSSQMWGCAGFTLISGYIAYKAYAAISQCVRGSEKTAMTLKDAVLLRLVLGCAAQDLAHIRSGTLRVSQVEKVDLSAMSPAYAAETEFMRQEFINIVKACKEDDSYYALLESLYVQWNNAVEKSCAQAQSLFAPMKTI